jgi:CCR4-NOT transcription complex subunit 7/8
LLVGGLGAVRMKADRGVGCAACPSRAQDTEFPGVVARPIGSFRGSSDYHYQTLRCNVDLLRVIQLGLTLADAQGELAPGVCTWQFNFKFSIK